jgi:hypothetical protein
MATAAKARPRQGGGKKSEADFEDRLNGYKEVPDRIIEFIQKYPEGSLTRVGEPSIVKMTVPRFDADGEPDGEVDRTYIQYTAAAFRHPLDPAPGIGTVWEPFPGMTPYTRDSEIMNAETSAWGRALVAIGILSKGEKIASRQEVAARATTADSTPETPIASEAQIGVLVDLAKLTKFGSEHSAEETQAMILKRLAAAKSEPVTTVFGELTKALGESHPDELATAGSTLVTLGTLAEAAETAAQAVAEGAAE